MKPGWKRLEADASAALLDTWPTGLSASPSLKNKAHGLKHKNTPEKTACEVKATLGTVSYWVYLCMTE